MNGTLWADSLVVFWIVYAVTGVAAGMLVVRWAVKTKQFKDPGHCARLPLEGTSPDFGRGTRGEEEEIDV